MHSAQNKLVKKEFKLNLGTEFQFQYQRIKLHKIGY